MKSIDTNIFLYAVNSDCSEHQKCRELINCALGERDCWIIADQIWFELYRLLRNPAVLASPLPAAVASEAVKWYRESSGWLQCSWEPDLMDDLYRIWDAEEFPARNCFDAKLALTLKHHGVTEFYTRNVKDFKPFVFFDVINPID